MKNVYIVDAVRTPVGKAPRGVFKDVMPNDMLIQLMQHMQNKNNQVDWHQLGDVVIGCAMPEAEQGMNIARIAVLRAGFADTIPAMTINRFCASGIQSIAIAANAIAAGAMPLALAGGVESMSKVPLGGNKYMPNPAIFENEDLAIAFGMGITAEKVAQRFGISRTAQDEFALASHQKALLAQQQGFFEAEIVPLRMMRQHADLTAQRVCNEPTLISTDEGPRAETSLLKLAQLKPVFALHGTVTAGNTSQTSDGAGMALLASEDAVAQYQLTPLGRLVSFAVAGVPPEIMGIGPIKSIPMALQQAGLTLQQIDWIELNEAFAAQALAVIQALNLPAEKVNPLGGAIALGHPLGATGAIRTATLLHGLKRTGGRYGMVTMCIGTGMGATAIFEV